MQPASGGPGAQGRWSKRIAALLLSALGLAAWGFALHLPLTGVDAWPLLEQAQRALRDPGVLARERYLEGMPIGASFWRPLFVAAVSLQWSAFGESPLPYHVLRLAAYLGLAALAGALASRRGAAPGLAWFTAGAIVLLHPLQADMVPSLARSADVLCDLLLAATILLLSAPQREKASLAAGAVLALIVPGVKETGLAAALIGVLVLAPWSRGAGRARRLCALALLLGLALHIAARLATLGELGSYTPRAERVTGPLRNAALLVQALTDRGNLPLAVLTLALVVPGLLFSLAGRPVRQALSPQWLAVRRGCWAWLACAGIGALLSPRLAERHGASLLAPAGVLLAALLGALRSQGDVGLRAHALRLGALAALVAALALALAPRSPLWRRYPQWDLIGRTSQLAVDGADAAARELVRSGGPSAVEFGAFRLIAQRRGDVLQVDLDPFPYSAAPQDGGRNTSLRQPAILMPYSLVAALRLRGHGGEVRVGAGEAVPVLRQQLGPLGAPHPAARSR